MNSIRDPQLTVGNALVPVTDFTCPPGAAPVGTHPEVAAATADKAPSVGGRPGRRCAFSCARPLTLGATYVMVHDGARQGIRVIAESGTRYTAELVSEAGTSPATSRS